MTLTIDAEGYFLPSLFRLFEILNRAAADCQVRRGHGHFAFEFQTTNAFPHSKREVLFFAFYFPLFREEGEKTFLCGTADGFSLSLPLLLSAALEKKLFSFLRR